MAFKGDFIPPNKMIGKNGDLVPKIADPYVEIERLKLEVANLTQRMEGGENADIRLGIKEAKAALAKAESDLKAANLDRDAALAEAARLRSDLEAMTIKRDALAGQLELAHQPKPEPSLQQIAEYAKAKEQAEAEARALRDDLAKAQEIIADLQEKAGRKTRKPKD